MENNTVLIGIPCLMVGGTEVQTLRLVEALVDGGYRVVVVCYFEHNPEVVGQYKQAGAEVCLLSPEGKRPQGTIAQVRFLFKGLREVVRKYRPEVAHVQYMAPGALPIVALRLLGVRTILATVHTMADIYRNTRLVRFLQRHLLQVFTCITLTAEKSFFGSSQLYSPTLPLKRHNHFTIYNCLKDPKGLNDPKDSKGPNRLRIGFVSRLERIKGADLVVPAYAALLQEIPSATLSIVGSGSQLPLMCRQAAELPEGSVEFAGSMPSHELPSFYRRIDVLWMPSRSEGFGLTAVEAIAEGCPVVAARTGGLPELLKDERLLCLPESPTSLAQTTIALLRNPVPLPDITPYSFAIYKENILSLYSSIINHHS